MSRNNVAKFKYPTHNLSTILKINNKLKKYIFILSNKKKNIQVEPRSMISATWPKVMHGQKQVTQPERQHI